MADQALRQTRCAIYTRQSVSRPQPEEFGSLSAQRAICSSYIASQRPRGWSEIAKHYSDADRSGRNLRRPGLQDLIADIESGLIDVVVIYKLDRITRTLLDFVRLMDMFERFRVEFVAVTQNFDTGNSTGRLILNVLLTFAQFEREIASDRLRDKFSVMKELGLFIGGNPPFGYDLINKRLVVNDREAPIVRTAFERYLEAKSYVAVTRDVFAGIIRRDRKAKRGHIVRGRSISTGAVYNMLKNPVYVGDVAYHGRVHPGEHEGIVPRALWEEVQTLRKRRTRSRVVEIHKTDLLRGLLFDDFGRRVSGFRDYRYNTTGTRYYRSTQTDWGRRNSVRCYRAKAGDLERLVVGAIKALLADRQRIRALLISSAVHDRRLDRLCKRGVCAANLFDTLPARRQQLALGALVERIELTGDRVQIIIRVDEVLRYLEWDGIGLFKRHGGAANRQLVTHLLSIPTTTVRMKRDLRNLIQQRAKSQPQKPNKYLLGLLSKARHAQAMLYDREFATITEVATRLHVTHARVPRLVRLNYLAPDILASILDGTQPRGLTGHVLMATDLPLDWSLQRRLLGFPDQADSLRPLPGW